MLRTRLPGSPCSKRCQPLSARHNSRRVSSLLNALRSWNTTDSSSMAAGTALVAHESHPGTPLSVTDSTDVAGTGQGGAPWNLAQSLNVSGDRGVGKAWFNPAAFSLPRAGTFGNAGLGII